ncbi:MAG: 16S rRNA (uracil(1498)-N(3))-methyltransferase [Salinibacter sp.]
MTTNFYAPPAQIRGDRVVLPDGEARHARSVLRAETGDEIAVVDGEGGWYRVRLDHVGDGQVVGHIVDARREVGEPDVAMTVGLGLLTKRSRLETFVEKAVELGVRRLVPLRTRHTEPTEVRADRLRRVMVAALKQCRRSRLPELTAPQSLDALLEATTADVRFLCHGGEHPPLLDALDGPAPDDVLALVGPEGGFAPGEVAAATAAGCIPVSLGPRRLRAETAGLAAINAVMLYDQHRRAP